MDLDRIPEKRSIIPDTDIGMLLVLLGAVFAGLRPLFGRWLLNDNLTAVIIAFYTYTTSAALFLPVGFRATQGARRYRKTIAIAFAGGLFVGLGGMAYFEALQRLPVATVTLINFTYPAMVITAVAFIQRRWPQPLALLAVACVLLGSGFIVGPKLQNQNALITDFAIAFISPLSWSLLLILLAGRLTTLPLWSRIGFISSGATVAMIIMVVLWQPSTLLPQTATGWWGFLGLVVLSGVLTHIILTVGVPKAGPEKASITGVFEVATALVVGWVVFLEPITANQVTGVLFIGAALLLTRRFKVQIPPKF